MKDNLESLAQRLDEVVEAADKVVNELRCEINGIPYPYPNPDLDHFAVETMREAQARRRLLTLIIPGVANEPDS